MKKLFTLVGLLVGLKVFSAGIPLGGVTYTNQTFLNSDTNKVLVGDGNYTWSVSVGLLRTNFLNWARTNFNGVGSLSTSNQDLSTLSLLVGNPESYGDIAVRLAGGHHGTLRVTTNNLVLLTDLGTVLEADFDTGLLQLGGSGFDPVNLWNIQLPRQTGTEAIARSNAPIVFGLTGLGGATFKTPVGGVANGLAVNNTNNIPFLRTSTNKDALLIFGTNVATALMVSNNAALTNTAIQNGQANAPSIYLGPGGNVGIGTATATNALTIIGNGSVPTLLDIGNLVTDGLFKVTTNGQVVLPTGMGGLFSQDSPNPNSGTATWRMYLSSGGATILKGQGTTSVTLRDSSDNAQLNVTTTGIGIGTATPVSALDVPSRITTSELSPTNGVIGRTNATDAAGGTNGYVGQFTNAVLAIGSALSMSTTITTNILTLTLTAGDWDVQANANFNEGAATAALTIAGISTNSVTLPTDGSEAYGGFGGTAITSTYSVTLPRKRINVSAPMTVYVVAQVTFSTGTVTGFGSITARRVR